MIKSICSNLFWTPCHPQVSIIGKSCHWKKTDMKEKSEDCHWKTQPNPRKYQKIKVLYINVIYISVPKQLLQIQMFQYECVLFLVQVLFPVTNVIFKVIVRCHCSGFVVFELVFCATWLPYLNTLMLLGPLNRAGLLP